MTDINTQALELEMLMASYATKNDYEKLSLNPIIKQKIDSIKLSLSNVTPAETEQTRLDVQETDTLTDLIKKYKHIMSLMSKDTGKTEIVYL